MQYRVAKPKQNPSRRSPTVLLLTVDPFSLSLRRHLEVIAIPVLAFNFPSSSLRIENCIAHQSGPDKYIKSKANRQK